jgi:hypothetical protein
MGKNPDAKKNKTKYKGTERTFDNKFEDLEEEASRKGVEVWELKKVKKQNKNKNSDSDEDEENESSSGDENNQKEDKKSSDEEKPKEELKIVDYDKKFGNKIV